MQPEEIARAVAAIKAWYGLDLGRLTEVGCEDPLSVAAWLAVTAHRELHIERRWLARHARKLAGELASLSSLAGGDTSLETMARDGQVAFKGAEEMAELAAHYGLARGHEDSLKAVVFSIKQYQRRQPKLAVGT